MWYKKYFSYKHIFEISRTFMNISGKILGDPVFGCFFLGLSIFYSFILIFYGIDFSDTFFHLNVFKNIKLHPLTGLTSLIGIFWMKQFGDYLLSFRILNLLLLNLSIIIPFIFIVPKTQRLKNFFLLGIAIILFATLNPNVFNYDSVTLFLLSFSSVWAIKYYQRGNISYLVAYGLFSALLILARFPNIIILPLSIVILALIEYQRENKDKKKFLIKYCKVTLLYLFVSVSFFVLILYILYGNMNEFFPRVVKSISGLGKHYTLKSLVWRYLFNFVRIFQYIAVIVLLNIIGNRARVLSMKLKFVYIFFTLFLFSLFLRLEINIRNYNWELSLFFSAICYALLIHYAYYCFKKHANDFLIFTFILLGFSIIPAMGSNTGLLKTSLFLLCYLPFLLLYLKKSQLLNNKLIYAMLSILVFFSIYTRMRNVYEDSAITNLNCELKSKSLQYIYTTKNRSDFIEDVLSVIGTEKNKNHPILLYGKVSHIFYYLTNVTPLFGRSFFMPTDDTDEIARLAEVVKNIRPVIFLIMDYPNKNNQNGKIEQNSKTQFEDLLLSYDYSVSVRNGFKVYYPE